MSMTSFKLPLWLRFVLIAGVAVLAAGAGLFAYRYYTRPVTLTVAVGSIDGEAAKAMSAIASKLVTINAPVRLTVIDTGTALAAAKTFSSGKADLAVVRGDVGDLSQAQAVVVVSHMVALVIAPPGSSIDDMAKLKGHSVGVIGGEANSKLAGCPEQGIWPRPRQGIQGRRTGRRPTRASIEADQRAARCDSAVAKISVAGTRIFPARSQSVAGPDINRFRRGDSAKPSVLMRALTCQRARCAARRRSLTTISRR